VRKITSMSGKILIICVFCVAVCVVLGFVGVNILNSQADIVKDYDFPLEQLWVYQASEDVQAVTISSDGQIIIRTSESIFSLAPTNGKLIWLAKLPQTFGSGVPIISNNVVVVAHSQGTNAYNLKTGEQLWQATDNASRGHRTFVATANTQIVVVIGGFIAIRDLQTGELLQRIERAWPGANALATIDGNNLYVIFLNQIRCYDVTSGKLIWSEETPQWSLRGMLFEDNVLYLENSSSDGFGAFDVEVPKLIWQQKGRFESYSHPIAKYEDYLFVPVTNHVPLALDTQTGDIIWEAKGVPNDKYLTPLVVDNIVYVKGLLNRRLYALDLQSGDMIGYLDLGLPNIFPSARSTSVGPFQSGSLIIFADNERIFAYGK
jgi:outer membrane protein assembly factor BamB